MEIKKFILLSITVLLGGLALTACSGSDSTDGEIVPPTNELADDSNGKKVSGDSMVVDMLPETRAIKLTEEQKQVAQKINDFTFNLYRAVWQTEKKSNITSPMSVAYIIGMLNDGASGKTAQEMMQVLGLGNDGKTDINEFCKALISQAPQADPSVILQIANLVAANKDIILSDAYRQDMHNFYDAEVTSLDFSQPKSLDYLNGWCNEKSNGMIPTIIDRLSPNDLMVLMNAVYFKAPWTNRFDTKDTKSESFTKGDGNSATIPMMYRRAEILYSNNDIYSSIRLPFGSGDIWSMYVILPAEGKTIDEVVNSFTNLSWDKQKAAGKTIVDIKLPRFSTTSDILLNDIIASLGAPTMFISDKAEFTGISKDQEMYINLIKQKAAIEVSEEGTKTSAVTVARSVGANGSVKTAEFHANRPFVYIIQEMNTNAIFFIGTYMGD